MAKKKRDVYTSRFLNLIIEEYYSTVTDLAKFLG